MWILKCAAAVGEVKQFPKRVGSSSIRGRTGHGMCDNRRQRVVVLFLLCATAHASYNVSGLVLGLGLISNSPQDANPVRCGVQLAMSSLNNDSALLPDTQLFIRELGTDCTRTAAVHAMLIGARAGPYVNNSSGPMIGEVGPLCSSASVSASDVATVFRIPMISYGDPQQAGIRNLINLLQARLHHC